MSDILFEIKEENLETGLRGYPIGYCTTSTVDPIKGLFYAEIPIPQLASWEPEKVIYLLYQGREGSESEVAQFTQDMRKRANCSADTIKYIQALPRTGHPMQLFAASLLVSGMIEWTNNYREDCLNLIAQIPQLAAATINYHAGWGKTPESRPELGYMENFTQMVNVPNGDKKKLGDVFKLFNVLHYDHGGGNLSTFVGKAVASSLENMHGSLSSAMCALAGPLHGKANQEALEFVKRILTDLGENATTEQMDSYLRQLIEKKELLYGFGHAVLRVEDPRAKVLYDMAEKEYPNNPLVKISLLLRKEGSKVLKENPKISNPFPNVDAISGTLLSAAGFPYPEYFTLLFGLSRVVGIAIQIVYERCDARDGKGTPLVRPKYIYKSRY